MTESEIDLLQELISARGPCGQEKEVRDIAQREFSKYTDKTWEDDAGNLVCLIKAKGVSKGQEKEPIRVFAHMDEISMMVKRVNADGTLRVVNLGGLLPSVLGQGPVEIMGNQKIISGVLSLGSQHTSSESANIFETKTNILDWSHLHVFTNLSPEELKRAGVKPGTRVVIAKRNRTLFHMDDCLAGYYMDDRAGMLIAIQAAKIISEKQNIPQDIYWVMSAEEEKGGIGASYASRILPGSLNIALDIGPVAEEYDTKLTEQPIIVYGDDYSLYSKSVTDDLYTLGESLGMKPQSSVFSNFGSDASCCKKFGQGALAALICFPTHNTHGYEIIKKGVLQNCTKLLSEYLAPN